jgi:DNA-binding response OmpR family regulator
MGEHVRVVVVDDLPDAADALAEMLRMDGYDVDVAYDGESALRSIAARTPRCVLLDIGMPGIDGHEVARRLRADHGSNIVLIAITGWGDSGDRGSAGFAHFDHCLRKPLDFAELATLLPPLAR